MGYIHQLPETLRKFRSDTSIVIDVIEKLLPPGVKFQDLSDADKYNLLAKKLDDIQIQINNLQDAVEKSVPIFERFDFLSPKTEFVLDNIVNEAHPVTVVYETLPQKLGIDFEIDGDRVRWINPTDSFVQGIVEVTYYKL